MTNSENDNALIRKNRRLGLIVLITVVAMIGVSFAAVPLYTLFCRVTGFGGTTQVAETLPDTILDRRVTVQFNADTGRGMPWTFRPEQREITVKLGQKGVAAYHARNTANAPTGGTAIYNITPPKAGRYFHKIQCFCFDEQVLAPQESVSMPVLFYVDPAMNDDPAMDDVTHITLSYTFYTAESDALDKALEAFYNDEKADTH